MELSEICGGHFCHMGYGSEMNCSVIIDDFGNALSINNFSLEIYLQRIGYIFENRYA